MSKKLVSATLAGALAVGMVPAMAFAADGDVEMDLLLSEEADLIAKGEIVFANDKVSGDTFVAGTDSACPTIEGVKGYGKNAVTKTGLSYVYWELGTKGVGAYASTDLGVNTDFTLNGSTFYVKKDSLKAVAPTTPGNYVVLAKYDDNGTDVWVTKAASYTVKAADVAGIYMYEPVAASETEKFADTVFTYDGDTAVFGLTNGTADVTSSFTCKILDTKTNTYTTTPTDAGTYKVTAVGNASTVYAGQTLEFTLTVNPFDLGKDAKLAEGYDIVEKGTVPGLANIVAPAKVKSDLAEVVSYKQAVDALGNNAINYTLKPTANAANYTGTGSLPFIVVGDEIEAADIKLYYANTLFSSVDKNIDYSDGDKALVASNFSVKVVERTANTQKEVALESGYSLKVMKLNADGKTYTKVDPSELQNSGTYEVSAVVEPGADFATAGESAAQTVTVTAGDIQASDIAFVYNGTAVESANQLAGNTIVWDGKDKMDKLAITVWDKNGKVVPAADYTVSIAKTALIDNTPIALADQAVDKIVDAGKYTVKVTSTKYSIDAADATINIVVNDLPTGALAVDAQLTKVAQDKKTYPALFWTGKDIAPVVQFDNSNTAKVELVDLDSSAYKMSILSYYNLDWDVKATPKTVKDAGWYQVKFADASAKDNYDVQELTTWICVTDTKVFADVPAGKWYTDPVYQAASLGYVNGIGGTNTFGPNRSITRAQLVAILFNMAGWEKGDYQNYLGEDIDLISFSDVNERAWYAEAVSWAKDAGVVNGRGDGTLFDPEADVTRQEAAAMFANYAAAFGEYEAPAADALASFPDAGKVSGWAEEVVAWAAENDVIGNGGVLNPQGKLTRAEAAAMAVNFQPEGKKDLSKF